MNTINLLEASNQMDDMLERVDHDEAVYIELPDGRLENIESIEVEENCFGDRYVVIKAKPDAKGAEQ